MLEETFWKNIFLIKKVLLINSTSMAQLLGLDYSTYKDHLRKKRIPEINHLYQLLERLKVSLDDFFEESFDLIQMREAFLGNYLSMPSKYSYAALSSSRTITNCLKYLEETYGIDFTECLFRSLRVDFRFFDRPDRWLNINFSRDLFKLLRASGFRDIDFLRMGQMSYKVNVNTDLGEELASARSLRDLYEAICEEHSFKFDKNFNYFITRFEGDAIYVGSSPREEVVEALKNKTLITEDICLTKRGVFKTFSHYIGKNSDVSKTKCMISGDPFFEYKISLNCS